jgi:hypothetical protein
VHDIYHPRPGQQGEGRPGSGQLIRWTEPVAATARQVVHAICVDSAADIAGWNIRGNTIEGRERWTLRLGDRLRIEETISRQAFTLAGNSLTKDM